MAMPTSGRTAMLRECLTSGEETQKNSLKLMCAQQTGVLHGRPAASAVASTR
jgi:hypothetical protein